MHCNTRQIKMDSNKNNTPTPSQPLAWAGGRKFFLSILGLIAIVLLAFIKGDPVALIVGAYSGANGYIEGKYARTKSQVIGDEV